MPGSDPHPVPLAGSLALVTGAGSGIGRAITRRLVSDGAQVVAADIQVDALATLAAEHPGRIHPVRCDVTSESDVADTCDVAAGLGALDIVVANAGAGSFGLIADQQLSTWQGVLDLCLTGVFLTIKHASAVMSDGGSIVTVASLNATQPAAGMSAYCAAKAGVVMLTRVAAMELGARRIRVNSVAPGLVETSATAPMMAVPGVVEEFVDNTTLGRFAQPEEIAAMVAFLAGPESTFVSGSSFAVDGGAATKRYPDLPAAFARLATNG